MLEFSNVLEVSPIIRNMNFSATGRDDDSEWGIFRLFRQEKRYG